MKLFPFVILLLLCSCFSRSAIMTRKNFDTIVLGAPIDQVKEMAGKPYAIHNRGSGIQEYEYIERIDTGDYFVTENHYLICVQDGKVISKCISKERPPAYEIIYENDPNNIQ
jgi:hypothetical protein